MDAEEKETVARQLAIWIDAYVIADLIVEALENEDVKVTFDQGKELWLACLEDIGPILTTIVQHRYV